MKSWSSGHPVEGGQHPYVPGPYQPDAYFAFVESMDDIGRTGDGAPKWWLELLGNRERSGLKEPSHFVWLDCVRAKDFLDLNWLLEPCEIGDAEHALRRRNRINALSPEMFKVAVVLLNGHAAQESNILGQFTETAWHRVSLGSRPPGLPVIVAPDFDLADGAFEHLRFEHFGACSPEERNLLMKVFNLNFIADADFGDEEGSAPKPSTDPNGGGRKIQEFDWTRALAHARPYSQY